MMDINAIDIAVHHACQRSSTRVLSNLMGRDGYIKAEWTAISAQRVGVRYATVALGVDTFNCRLLRKIIPQNATIVGESFSFLGIALHLAQLYAIMFDFDA